MSDCPIRECMSCESFRKRDLCCSALTQAEACLGYSAANPEYQKWRLREDCPLAALIAGLTALRDDWTSPERVDVLDPVDCTDELDALFLAHGFAPEAEVPREAAPEPASGVASTDSGKGA